MDGGADALYPQYGFRPNKGCTAEHIAALKRYGPRPCIGAASSPNSCEQRRFGAAGERAAEKYLKSGAPKCLPEFRCPLVKSTVKLMHLREPRSKPASESHGRPAFAVDREKRLHHQKRRLVSEGPRAVRGADPLRRGGNQPPGAPAHPGRLSRGYLLIFPQARRNSVRPCRIYSGYRRGWV